MPHSELWHQLYAEEETQLCNAIGGQVVAIEHVGSTAICGLSAKPIIDIAVAVRENVNGSRINPDTPRPQGQDSDFELCIVVSSYVWLRHHYHCVRFAVFFHFLLS